MSYPRYFCAVFFFTLLLSSRITAAPHFDGHYRDHFDDFSVELLLSGFDQSWALEALPNRRLLLGEWKTGRLYLMDLTAQKIHLLGKVDNLYTRGQGGLLDIKVAVDFAQTGRIFFSRSTAHDDNATTELWTAVIQQVAVEHKSVSRFSFWRSEPSPYELVDQQLLFSALPEMEGSRHFGGALVVANDQVIMSVGDRGYRHEAQKLESHLGKILSFTLQKHKNSISLANKPEIVSLGHRNPQGLSRIAADGSLWAAEHGPQGGDEVNRIKRGANYGWPVISYGEEYGGGEIGEGHVKAGMEQPLIYYTPSLAISALAYYGPQASQLPALRGHFLLLSLKAREIKLLQREQQGLVDKGLLFENIHERWRNIAIAEEGDVFLLAESGKVYRLFAPKSH